MVKLVLFELIIVLDMNDILINPSLPSAHKSARIAKFLILKLEGTIEKISYERRDYESVDEKSLFSIQAVKG